MVMNASKDIEINQCITLAAGAAGTSDINGSSVDMQGFEGCLFVFQFGPIVAAGVQSIKIQQDIVTAMGAAADLLGTNQVVADDDDNTIFYIDIVRPRERFLRPVVTRATQNATVAVTAYKYRAHDRPVTQPSATVQGEIHVSPIEGTA